MSYLMNSMLRPCHRLDYKILPLASKYILTIQQDAAEWSEFKKNFKSWFDSVFYNNTTPEGLQILTRLPASLRKKLSLQTQLAIMQSKTQEGFVRFIQTFGTAAELLDVFLEKLGSNNLQAIFLEILKGRIQVTQEGVSLYCQLSRETCEKLDETRASSFIRKILCYSLQKETSEILAKIVHSSCEAGISSSCLEGFIEDSFYQGFDPSEWSQLWNIIETYPTLLKELTTADSPRGNGQVLRWLRDLKKVPGEGIQGFLNLPPPLKEILRSEYNTNIFRIILEGTAYGFSYLTPFAEIFSDILQTCSKGHLNLNSIYFILMNKPWENQGTLFLKEFTELVDRLKEDIPLRNLVVSLLRSLTPETQALLLNAMLPNNISTISITSITCLSSLSPLLIGQLASNNSFFTTYLENGTASLSNLNALLEQNPELMPFMGSKTISEVLKNTFGLESLIEHLNEKPNFKNRLLCQLEFLKESELLPLISKNITSSGIDAFLVLEQSLINKCGLSELVNILCYGKSELAGTLNDLLQQHPKHFEHLPAQQIQKIVSVGDQEPTKTQTERYFSLPDDVITMLIERVSVVK